MTSSALIQGWVAREGPVPRIQAGLSCALPAFRIGGSVLRCILLTLILPALVLAAESPPVPNGVDLLKLPYGEFQSYVSGIYEGQVLLSEAMGAPQVSCVDASMTRTDLANIVLYGLSRLSKIDLTRPGGEVVFRVLIEQLPCPGVRWESD